MMGLSKTKETDSGEEVCWSWRDRFGGGGRNKSLDSCENRRALLACLAGSDARDPTQ